MDIISTIVDIGNKNDYAYKHLYVYINLNF